jgi:capsular polysaccharide biosynthesis protein
MPETFEMFRYLDHLRRRWRLVAVACGVAAGLALLATLLTPAQYTATARIMIEPPAGSDPRMATAVSPIYLESLKSYELVASGDRMFLEAMEHFKLPRSKSVNAMKRAVLKASIPRNTKILEISATLHDPTQAQALALYIAEQTVSLARNVSAETEQDLLAGAQKQLDEAQARWQQVQSESAQAGSPLESELWTSRRDAARNEVYAASEHVAQVQSAAGSRGERLKVVDPGVVPERPSWPNIPLVLLAALFAALAGSLLCVALEFNYRLEKSAAPRSLAPVARVKTLND